MNTQGIHSQSLFLITLAINCAIFSLIGTILLAFRYLGEKSPDFHLSTEPTVLARDQLLTLVQGFCVLAISGATLIIGRLTIRHFLPSKPTSSFLGVTELYLALLLTLGLGLLSVLSLSFLSKARSLGRINSLFSGQIILLICGISGIWLLISFTFLTWPELRTERWLPVAVTGSVVTCLITMLFTLYSYAFTNHKAPAVSRPLALDHHDFALSRLVKYSVGLTAFCLIIGALSLIAKPPYPSEWGILGVFAVVVFSYGVAELIEGSFIAPPRIPSAIIKYISRIRRGILLAVGITVITALVLFAPKQYWGSANEGFVVLASMVVVFTWMLSVPTTTLFASANAKLFSASLLDVQRRRKLDSGTRWISAGAISGSFLVLVGHVVRMSSLTSFGLLFASASIIGIYPITNLFLHSLLFLHDLKDVSPLHRRTEFINKFATPALSKLPSIFLYETAVDICEDLFPNSSSAQLLSMLEHFDMIEFSDIDNDNVGNITARGIEVALRIDNLDASAREKLKMTL